MNHTMPDKQTMYKALVKKDSNFEGIFFVAVKTTGVFCRPTCRARKPKKENVEFFSSSQEALLNGFRPCRICHPLEYHGEFPDWLKPLIYEIKKNPEIRLKDKDLKVRGIDPNRVRRWFEKHHQMTFQTYLRTLRISSAFSKIKSGEKVIEAAFDSGYESLSGFTDYFKKSTGFSPVKSRHNQIITITKILTPLGPMIAGATDKGVYLLEFIDRRMLDTQINRLKKLLKTEFLPGPNKHLVKLGKEISEYFEGKRKRFSVPLILTGTPFQKKAWQILANIPYGATRSYKEQAKILGNAKAVRAVARANGDNKIAIIIPCHRVIGSNGKLTGYGGGLWRKKYLLNLELKNI